MIERVEELVGSRIEEVRVDGGLAYLDVSHRGTDDEACTLLVRIPEIEWKYGDWTEPTDDYFIPEGDRTCGVVHRLARATCMKRRAHDGPHATPQGTWIDGPWCEYPEEALDE